MTTGAPLPSRAASCRRAALSLLATRRRPRRAARLALDRNADPSKRFRRSTTSAYAQTAARPVGFADIVEKVKPSVMSVRVKVDASRPAHAVSTARTCRKLPPGSPFEYFFKRFGAAGRQGHTQGMPRRRNFSTGQGSGFFISADGYAVTNNHVVDKAESVEVTTDDGKTYTAKVIGTDPRTDLALIKVDGRNDFPFVKLARQRAAHRRLGAGGRQSVRPRRHRDRRHRVGARPRHRRRPV